MLLEFAVSGCPIFRAKTRLSSGKLKSNGKRSIHYCADQKTIEDFFSNNCFCQSAQSLRNSCKHVCRNLTHIKKDRGNLMYWWDNQFFLSRQNDIPSHQNVLLQRFEERIKLLSPESKANSFCKEAGSIHVIEVGQYFMTERHRCFYTFRAVKCHENTLPRDDGSTQPRGTIQGDIKIGPVLEVTTSYLYGMHRIEIRIWFLKRENSHSWVRISHGSKKFVIDLNYSNTNSCRSAWRTSVTIDCEGICSQIKGGKQNHKDRELVDVPSIIPMNERKSIDIEPGEFSFFAYEISKKVINLFRHTPTVQREENGAVQFWKIRIIFRIKFHKFRLGLMVVRKYACQQEEERKRDINCTDASGTIDYFRAFQGHSGRNFIDPSLQDNVIIQSGFFQHSYHIRCVLNLHSINNNGQYSFCPLIPETKVINILQRLTSLSHVEHNTCTVFGRNIKTRYFWVDINLAIQKRLTFYQTRSNAIILQRTLPA